MTKRKIRSMKIFKFCNFCSKKYSQILKSMLEHGLYGKVESLKREKSLYKSSIYDAQRDRTQIKIQW